MAKILVACEESQVVTIELRNKGHEAYSCDIEPCSGGHPEWHLQQNVIPLLNEKWDAILAFPPCTYLTNSANKYYDIKKYGKEAELRLELRKVAIDFFILFVDAKCKYICIENPVGIMSKEYAKPTQIICPSMFGEDYEKRTCLWLKGLPKLTPTHIKKNFDRMRFPSGNLCSQWTIETWNLPAKERAKIRSKTPISLAKAMAEQWDFYFHKETKK